MNKINSSREEMQRFWNNLIGKSIEFRRVRLKNQTSGRPDVDSIINHYADMTEGIRQRSLKGLEIYGQDGLERVVTEQPETIDVSLLVDCSGSMSGGVKMDVAILTAALLMYSVKDFNEALDMTRYETQSNLKANTEVYRYDDKYEKLKQFERDQDTDTTQAEIIRTINELRPGGSTDDSGPLSEILNSISQEERDKIKNGKLKKIVFEITDGEPDDAGESRECITRLAEQGVLVIGFQIGDVYPAERESFDYIWNKTGNKNVKGIFIGKSVKKLPARLIETLADSLRDIAI